MRARCSRKVDAVGDLLRVSCETKLKREEGKQKKKRKKKERKKGNEREIHFLERRDDWKEKKEEERVRTPTG